MASAHTLSLMISSRSNSIFDGNRLSEIRKALKRRIEETNVFGAPLFQVYIHEDDPGRDATEETWNSCLKEARESDIVIVLYNGEAGWTVQSDDSIGICHAEMVAAMEVSMQKVYLVDISNGPIGSEAKDKNFQAFIHEHQIWRVVAKNQDELNRKIDELMHEIIYRQMKRGLAGASKVTNMGQHLVWKRMNYDVRTREIKKAITASLKFEDKITEESFVIFNDNGQRILFKIHAIPDSVSISAAKEKVGQPFLSDFMLENRLKAVHGGPVHLIGCYKTVTETQVRKIMGFPDVILIKDEFGIYVADKIYKIQMVFLEKCIGKSETLQALERFFDWLYRSGESTYFLQRAKDRKEIVLKIAEKREE